MPSQLTAQRDQVLDALVGAIQSLATETQWPAGPQGDATALLSYDLAEHCWLLAVAFQNERLAAAFTLLRPIVERTDSISAASVDRGFARRLLESPMSPGDLATNKKRARPDDGRDVAAHKRHPTDPQARNDYLASSGAMLSAFGTYLHGSTLLGVGATLGAATDPEGDGAYGNYVVIGSALYFSMHSILAGLIRVGAEPDFDAAAAAGSSWLGLLDLVTSKGSEEFRTSTEDLRSETRRMVEPVEALSSGSRDGTEVAQSTDG